MKKEDKKLRLFENDLTITGKHATYIKFLVNDAKLFNAYIDVYINATIFGYLNNDTKEKDNESTDRARIYADAFSTHREECMFLYRIITLLDENDISVDERVNRAFRYDAVPEKADIVKTSIDKFNAYMRGGVEYMYSQLTTGCTSKDDYIRKSFEITKKFKDDIDGVSYEEQIKKLLAK